MKSPYEAPKENEFRPVLMSILRAALSQTIPGLGAHGEMPRRQSIDDRLSRLAKILQDLEDAAAATRELRDEAEQTKEEAEKLKAQVLELQIDKQAAEKLANVEVEPFLRILDKSRDQGLRRARLEGLALGFLSGFASSIAVWYITS
ncbi:hypothetical protein [Nannocystis bainbridge]|uniref:Uncharacterized protein n=1 Tax=Nannocystis bainbridge TaxID=2995303 RepID=A0ABT5EC35_9BACT|nr:hypothetical protein [Nannocystis bainbridge]MDC0723427.1 hypothetical protein [Nannocystis bainbridge]